MKQLRFALIKAVNVPINSLSASDESLEIILEKLDDLRSLFGGATLITNQSQSRFSVKSHPKAYSFCVERAARQIVVRTN